MQEATQLAVRESLKSITPFSSSVQQVLKALTAKPVDMHMVSSALALDPILSSAVLKLANCAFYGFPRQVEHIHEGCVLLGVHTLKQLMLSLSLIRAFPAEASQGLHRHSLWKHSIGVGVCARLLASKIGSDPEQAFTAGLLHDIGQFILDQTYPGKYPEVIAYQESNEVCLCVAEQQVFGGTHAEVGSFALNQWRLPEVYATVAAEHVDYRPDQQRALVALVHVADVLTKGLWISPKNDRRISPLAPQALTLLGLSLESLEPLLPAMQATSEETIGILLN